MDKKTENFTFISKLLDDEYKALFPNAKIFYSYLLSLHYKTPVSDDGVRYIDITLKDVRIFLNGTSGLATRVKNTLIAEGLIGEVRQPYKFTDRMPGPGKKKIFSLYIKKIIE